MSSKYQWADVEKFINDNGLFFSDADLRLAQSNPDAGMSIANYKIDYNNATTDDQRALANAGAEKIRKDYGGYTGGSDGSKFYLNEPSPQNYGYQQPADKQSYTYQQPGQQSSFNDQANIGTPPGYGVGSAEGGLPEGSLQNNPQTGQTPVETGKQNANIGQYSDWKNPYQDLTNNALDAVLNREEYVNPYADQQKAALDAVLNQEEFSYDPSQDPLWQSARKQYLREADRAQQDMMGNAAMLTGGMPSTAAMTAASQAGDYYRGQLNDRLAEYQGQAYDRYLNDRNFDYSQLDVLNKMSDSDYQKFIDDLGLKYDDLSVLNSLGQQARDEFDTDRGFGYNQWLDELGFQTDKENTKYEREEAQEQKEYERAQYAKEYADSTNDSLVKDYLSLYDLTKDKKYLDMAIARIEEIGK